MKRSYFCSDAYLFLICLENYTEVKYVDPTEIDQPVLVGYFKGNDGNREIYLLPSNFQYTEELEVRYFVPFLMNAANAQSKVLKCCENNEEIPDQDLTMIQNIKNLKLYGFKRDNCVYYVKVSGLGSLIGI